MTEDLLALISQAEEDRQWKAREIYVEPEKGSPKNALPAKRCECERPWLEDDAELGLRCVCCGSLA